MSSSEGSSSSGIASGPPPMLRAIQASLGRDLLDHIRTQSKVLVVGAGGIGCELIKNLALCGFAHVHVIDLDTIDVSNLNRQLLFRSHHVGMPKATVACEVATTNLLGIQQQGKDEGNASSKPPAGGNVVYQAIHGNVCDNDIFNVPFVSQFDVVLNALDNVTARRRVNRLCLAAKDGVGVPMIEAGTTGYLGQVSVITRSVQCYECRPQEPPKVYPICTIRSTPSAPVHTIVWAKECYKLLFHPNVEESMLYEAMDESQHGNDSGSSGDGKGKAKTDPDDDNDMEEGGYEPSVYMKDVLEYRAALCSNGGNDKVGGTPDLANGNGSDAKATPNVKLLARNLLRALYCDEINKQLAMDRYKTARKTPVAMSLSDDDEASCKAPTLDQAWSATQVWSQQECAAEFVQCLVDALERKPTDDDLLAEFDKDDPLAMRFVTAASNLRNYVFGIEPIQSYYSAKGIAGNIIPAIATTNAIVAGLQILQAFHVLRAQIEGKTAHDDDLVAQCRYINCVRQPSRNGLLLIASTLEPPNPNCYVCRSATVHVQLNLPNWTLQDFLDKVLKSELGFVEPALFLEGNGIYEEDEDDFVPNLSKRLVDLPCGGIRHGTVVLVEDYSQDMSVEVVVSHCDAWPAEIKKGGDEDGDDAEEPDPFKFVVGGSKPAPIAPAAASAAASSDPDDNGEEGRTNGGRSKPTDDDDDDDDVVEIMEDPGSDKKRASSDDLAPPHPKKRKGTETSDVIELD